MAMHSYDSNDHKEDVIRGQRAAVTQLRQELLSGMEAAAKAGLEWRSGRQAQAIATAEAEIEQVCRDVGPKLVSAHTEEMRST